MQHKLIKEYQFEKCIVQVKDTGEVMFIGEGISYIDWKNAKPEVKQELLETLGEYI